MLTVDGLPRTETGEILLRRTGDTSYVAISEEAFRHRFGDGPYTYNGLVSSDKCTDAWRSVLDDWKEQGLID